jgi:hypothetical protein
MKSVTVITQLWERNNFGKSPKGKGNWAFSIGDKSGYEDVTKAVFFYGSYADAKKAASKEALNRGKDIIYVLP